MNEFYNRLKKCKNFFLILIIIKIIFLLFSLFIFSRFTPLIDSNLYINGFYENDSFFRTRLISFLATFFNSIGGPYLSHFIFGMISCVGLFYYYFFGGERKYLLILLFMPSSLVWTSIVGKEAIYFGSFSMAIVLWSKYIVEDLSLGDFVLFLICLVLCTLLRPHYTISIFWLITSSVIIKNTERRAYIILLSLFVFGIIIGYFTIWEELLRRGWGAIDPLARASRFDELGIAANTGAGYDQFQQLISYGMIYGIIGPFFHEVLNRIEFLPFYFEGIFILFSPFIIFLIVLFFDFRNRRIFSIFMLWSIMPAVLILMIVHAPFGFLNPGSAIRWRVNFEPMFYLAPLLLWFRLIDEKK